MRDILVVGGGPAGLMTAYQCAKLGLSVTLIERKKNILEIFRACSAQFVLDDDYEGEKLEVTEDSIVFTRSGFSIPYNGAKVPIYHNYMISPNGSRVAFEYEDGRAEAIKFDKSKLLGGLLDLALGEGVEILSGIYAVDGVDMGSHVKISVKSDVGSFTLEARKLVIAEGVNCMLTGKFGFNKGRFCFGMPLICNYVVEGTKGIPHNSWVQYYGNAYHPMTEIMIGESTESEDALEITVGGFGNNKPDMFFERLIKDSPLKENLANMKVIKKIACGVKSYLSLEVPYKGNVLVVGDSAAHIEVINQGAIMCGYHAGNAISKELQGLDGFVEYTRWWNDAFMFNVEDKIGQIKFMQAINIKGNLADEEIDYLFDLLQGKRLRGEFNQYEVPKHFWQGLKPYASTIEANSPDLYKKVSKIFVMV